MIRDLERFMANSDRVFNTCSNQAVSLGAKLIEGNGLRLDLGIPIYRDGLNAEVLKNTLQTLELCINQVKELLCY